MNIDDPLGSADMPHPADVGRLASPELLLETTMTPNIGPDCPPEMFTVTVRVCPGVGVRLDADIVIVAPLWTWWQDPAQPYCSVEEPMPPLRALSNGDTAIKTASKQIAVIRTILFLNRTLSPIS